MAVGEEGEVRGRVARHERDGEGDAGDVDRLAAVEPDVGGRAADGDPGGVNAAGSSIRIRSPAGA